MPPPPARSLILLMAVATGLAVANIYYNQPILGLIGAGFGDPARAGLIPTATQVGYAAGILLLVPLSDQVDRRRLITVQGLGLALALLAAAAAPTIAVLVALSLFIGMCASLAQQILPFAAELAPPATRGRTVGTVMTGLLAGILLARTLSGFVGELAGWRAVFLGGAAVAAAMTVLLALRLPRSRPAPRQLYGRLLVSLWHLVRREPELRRAALTQGLLFAAFSAFWTELALLLREPPFHLGSAAAGLFGVLAAGGLAVAPLAGRLADSRGPRPGVRLGVVAVVAAFGLMAARTDLATLAVGVVVMDAGVQMAMISNQAIIYGLAGEARGRVNTVYIATMFVLGAVGSAAASLAWRTGGWPAVVVVALLLAASALVPQFAGRRVPATLPDR
ncbi:MAG: MFS transporter [Gluconacetobacter diazotrophicus]|nr:MFS transporter [Gluconacetobacter diazotrophicus]